MHITQIGFNNVHLVTYTYWKNNNDKIILYTMTIIHKTHIGFNSQKSKSDGLVEFAPYSDPSRNLTLLYLSTLHRFLQIIKWLTPFQIRTTLFLTLIA